MKSVINLSLLCCLNGSVLAHETKPVTASTFNQTETAAVGASPIQAALHYASFWNTGEHRYADLALASDFIDRTLPKGRAPGKIGVFQASAGFRSAIPDLRASVEDVLISGDKVLLRLRFTGHFTGKFGDQQGQGQGIDFAALDLYRIEHGKIKENWHIEDMQSFFQQIK